MTNWMTTAGIALIAGGIATLIVFRRTIWTGGAGRTRRSGAVAESSPRSTRAGKTARRGEPGRVRLPTQAGAPDISGSQQAEDILAGLAASDEAAEEAGGLAWLGPADHDRAGLEDDRAGLADDRAGLAEDLAGLADGRGGVAEVRGAVAQDPRAGAEDAENRRRRPRGGPMDMDDLRRQLRDALEDLKREQRDEPEPARPVDDPAPARRADVVGDRVDGWVRPQYGTEEGPTGDYWKPVPDRPYADDSSAYGWPVPVERLPAAPGYPALAEEAIEEAEPTAVVPQWPPARPSDRIEVPRTWSVRRWDTDAGGRDVWRQHNVADLSRRRRPSPRPNAGGEAYSTVYVSRHAAEPS